MKRKMFLFYILLFAVIGFTGYMWYSNRPKPIPVVEKDSHISQSLSYNEVNTFVYEQEDSVNLFFYSSDDVDSRYVIDNILTPILQSANATSFSNLIFVDLATLPEDTDPKYTKNNWGFYNWPTFIVMKITQDKGLETSDTLEWDPANPYNGDSVTTWLQAHGVKKSE
ncbi:MAG: hypothetical protein HUJ58_07070 [Erysipelotrichaceae bacterium]|nr:hypothetical protein [Erysipelotrichaceae bacterium]